MPQNVFTETSRKKYGGRVKNSIGGFFFGFFMLIGAFILLWYNEGRAVNTAKGLDEGLKKIVLLQEPFPVAENEGHLVHLSGYIDTENTIIDENFGIDVKALKLKSKARMYQWKEKTRTEKKDNLGGSEETTTTYSYELAWNDDLINSSSFKHPEGHQNPTSMPYRSYEKVCDLAKLGEFIVPGNLVNQVGNYVDYSVTESIQTLIPNAQLINNSDGKNDNPAVYIGSGDVNNPIIGDQKVSFSAAYPANYSIVARQTGNSLDVFRTSRGTSIQMISEGTHSADHMFEVAHSNNKFLTWMLRIGGFFLMFFAFKLITRPLVILGKVVPVVSRILNFGTGLFAGIISLILSLLIISIAWIWYRPIIGLTILGLALILIVFYFVKSKNKNDIQSVDT